MQARGQTARTALVQPHTHPQRGRVDDPQHGLPGHYGGAGFGIAAGHHAIGRGQQAHIGALLAQGGLLGGQALLILPRSPEEKSGRRWIELLRWERLPSRAWAVRTKRPSLATS